MEVTLPMVLPVLPVATDQETMSRVDDHPLMVEGMWWDGPGKIHKLPCALGDPGRSCGRLEGSRYSWTRCGGSRVGNDRVSYSHRLWGEPPQDSAIQRARIRTIVISGRERVRKQIFGGQQGARRRQGGKLRLRSIRAVPRVCRTNSCTHLWLPKMSKQG